MLMKTILATVLFVVGFHQGFCESQQDMSLDELIEDAATGAYEKVHPAARHDRRGRRSIFDSMTNAVSSMGNAVSSTVGSAYSTLGSAVSSSVDTVSSLMDSAVASVDTVVSSSIDTAAGLVMPAVKSAATVASSVGSAVSSSIDTASSVASSLGSAASSVVSLVDNAATLVTPAVKSVVSSLGSAASASMDSAPATGLLADKSDASSQDSAVGMQSSGGAVFTFTRTLRLLLLVVKTIVSDYAWGLIVMGLSRIPRIDPIVSFLKSSRDVISDSYGPMPLPAISDVWKVFA